MAKALTFRLEQAGPFDIDGDVRAARSVWRTFRAERYGFGDVAPMLAQNKKLALDDVESYGLNLQPADASGEEACVWRSPGCTAVCVLSTSMRGKWDSVRKARECKTLFLAEHPAEAILLIADDIRKLVRKYGQVLIRLNVASDLRWEYIAPTLFDIPGAGFYDYTKAPRKHRGSHPNYRLTFSVSELVRSEAEALEYVGNGGTAAVVFDIVKGDPLPATWEGFDVIDGDLSDARVFDPDGVIVGLRAKADGIGGDPTGFVRPGVAS